MSHTPGPWRAVIEDNGIAYVTADNAAMNDVCDLYHKENHGPYGTRYVQKANAIADAHLIAAAPEMLATLEIMESALRELSYFNHSDYAAGVIARAKGIE